MREVIIMEEILIHRKAELEVAAKNAIIEIYVIEGHEKNITTTLESKRKFLKDINVSLNEIENIMKLIESEKEDINDAPE